jgi:hypothetical protein
MKILSLLAKCNDLVYIVHTFNVLPLVPKEDVVSTYEVQYFRRQHFSSLHYVAP